MGKAEAGGRGQGTELPRRFRGHPGDRGLLSVLSERRPEPVPRVAAADQDDGDSVRFAVI